MILSRSEWGALPTNGDLVPHDRARIQFLTVHRDLELAKGADHTACPNALRAGQLRDQLDGKVDLGWNLAACPHGQLYDIRSQWMLAETGVGGTGEIDRVSLAIALLGAEPTQAGLDAIKGYWHFLHALFPGINIATHRGWDALSDCPGNDIVFAVQGWVEEAARQTNQ